MIGDNDWDSFFNLDEFSETAELDGIAVNGIFTDGAAAESFGTLSLENLGPVFLMKSDDVPDQVGGKVIVIRNKNYRVTKADPDGTGITTLSLGRY